MRREEIFRRSLALNISLLGQLCCTLFTVPSFGILGDFSSSRLLGFRGIFRCSAFPRFCILVFGVIFRLSTVLSLRLLGSPEKVNSIKMYNTSIMSI